MNAALQYSGAFASELTIAPSDVVDLKLGPKDIAVASVTTNEPNIVHYRNCFELA